MKEGVGYRIAWEGRVGGLRVLGTEGSGSGRGKVARWMGAGEGAAR